MKPTIIFILKDYRIVEAFRRKLGERFNIVFYHSKIGLYQLLFFTNPDLIIIDAHSLLEANRFNRFVSLTNLSDSVIVLGTADIIGYETWKLPINLLDIPMRIDARNVVANRGALLRYVYNKNTPYRVFDLRQGYYLDMKSGEIIRDSKYGLFISALMRWIVRNKFVSHSVMEFVFNSKLDVPIVGRNRYWLKQFDIAGKIISTGLNTENIFISKIHFTQGGNFVYHTTFSFDVVLEFNTGEKWYWEEVLNET